MNIYCSVHFVSIQSFSFHSKYAQREGQNLYFWNEMKTLSQPGLNINVNVNLLPQKLPKYSPAITNRYFP